MINKTTSIAITIGSMCGVTSLIDVSVKLHETNSVTPKGGVIFPIAQPTVVTTPKCTGSTPKLCAIGKINGIKIMVAEKLSINMPIKRRRMIYII
tara:strand:+ start:172 stop:456 length:285 start_codon:yes stop_codon:yes gene_type:complete